MTTTVTLSDLVTATRARNQLLVNSSLYTTTEVKSRINEALAEICDRIFIVKPDYLQKSAQINIVAATQYVSLPADFISLIIAKISTRKLLPVNQFADLNTNTDNTGDPSACFVEGTDVLWFDSIPSTSVTNGLTIYYCYGATELSSDGSLMALPDSWRSFVAQLAAIGLLQGTDMPWEGEMNNFEARISRKLDTLVRNVTGSAGRWDDLTGEMEDLP